MGLLHEIGDLVFDGGGPEFVAFGAEVEEVGHDVFGESAVGLEEGGADVHEGDGFAVGEGLEEIVDGGVVDAEFVGGFFAAWEDAEEEDLGIGEFGVELVEDGFDAGGGVGGWFSGFAVTGVVGADHEDDEFGFEAVEVAVVETPEDVFGAVAADAEVGGFVIGPCIPCGFACAIPALGDGVAEEDELGFAFFGDFVEGIDAAFGAAVDLGFDGEVGGGFGGVLGVEREHDGESG